MNLFLHILWLIFSELWIVVFPTDMIVVLSTRLRDRMNKGWVRKRIIRRYGIMGVAHVRWMCYGLTCIPGLGLLIAGSSGIGMFLVNIYWFILGVTNLIDFITSWDDPPWKRAAKYVSEKIQKLLENMGEASEAPTIPVPV